MNAPWTFAVLIGCASLVGCATLVPPITRADQPAAHEPGVWRKHEYSFAFMGFTSTYSCDGLADKLKLLLTAAGARTDIESRGGACASGFGRPDRFARADLIFYALSPRGSVAPSDAEPADAKPADAKPVEGVWRLVSFADDSPRELGIGDCELIEQFRHDVLPMFTTRNIEDRTTCVPNQESGSIINLQFDAFAPPPATRAPRGRPGGA